MELLPLVLQGGALALSSGSSWTDDPGAILILRNSSFQSNTARLDNGGVVNVGEFAQATVEGDGNVFEGNTCGADGGVFASTVDTLITVEGGTFKRNSCLLVSYVSATWLRSSAFKICFFNSRGRLVRHRLLLENEIGKVNRAKAWAVSNAFSLNVSG